MTDVEHDNDAGEGNTFPKRKKLAFAASAVILAAHVPLLFKQASRLWTLEHYQFFPLVIAASCYLAYQTGAHRQSLDGGPRFFTALLMGATCVLLAVAILLGSPWLATISAMCAMPSIAWLLGGRKLWIRIWPAWVLLWLAVPLPLGLDRALIIGMQRLATQWSSGVLDLLGYRHLVSGVVIELPGKSFLVEEACSGIHSLFAALTCTLFYGLILKRGLIRIGVLLIATTFWVVIVNTARVTIVTVLCSTHDLPIQDGLGHDLVGALTFTVALLLIASTERLLLLTFPFPFRFSDYFSRVFSQRRRSRKIRSRSWLGLFGKRRKSKKRRSDAADERVTTAPAPRQIGPALLASLIVIFAALGFGQFTFAGAFGKSNVKKSNISQLNQATRDSLPRALEGWTQTEFEKIERAPNDPNGAVSHIWRYDRDGKTVLVSIDGPFVGWHDLGGCLEGQGWKVINSEVRDIDGAAGQFMQLDTHKGISKYGAVVYAVFDGTNRPARPIESTWSFRTIRRFPRLAEVLSRTRREDEGLAASDSTTFQIQVFQESATPLSPDEETRLQSFLSQVVLHLNNPPSTSSD